MKESSAELCVVSKVLIGNARRCRLWSATDLCAKAGDAKLLKQRTIIPQAISAIKRTDGQLGVRRTTNPGQVRGSLQSTCGRGPQFTVTRSEVECPGAFVDLRRLRVAMNARDVSSSTLPRMRFTKDDLQHYRDISNACLAEVLDKYETYLYTGKRHIDPRRWKTVKSKENVVVYRERSTSDADLSHDSDLSSSSSNSSNRTAYHSRHEPTVAVETVSNSMVSGPGAALAAGTNIPVMICTATMPGTLEDAMYGSYVDDAASFRRRSAYEQDLADDIGMLATFDRPSKKDPFQFMGLTWVLRSFPGLGAVVKRRDFLLLQRIGLSRTSQGELIGFTITQSVPHRNLPELSQYDIIRGRMSMCTIYRQMDGQVDVFVQIVMQPGGRALSYFMIQETATSLMSVSKPMDVAQKKKLFWLMRKNAMEATVGVPSSPSARSDSSSSSSSMNRRLQRQESDHCASCKRSLTRLFSTAGSFCQICQKRVCSKCSMAKKLVIDAAEKDVVLRPFNFCIGCTLTARSYSSLQVHAEELTQRTRR